MGKHAVHSFCKLGAFVLLLYFAKVLSASTDQSIVDVMKNDKEVACPVPAFLYENNITKICSELKYSEVNVEPDYSFTNTFLCLVFYDTWYKVCKSNQSQSAFNSTTTFSSYMQKFFPKNTEADRNKFCQNVQALTISHKKLESLLSHAHLNNPHVCYPACFGMEEKFKPLCAILAWSISIDNSEKKIRPPERKVNELEQKKSQRAVELEHQIDRQELLQKSNSNIDTNKDNSLNNSPKNIAQKSSTMPSMESKPILPANIDPVNTEKQKTANDAGSTVLKQQKEILPNAESNAEDKAVHTSLPTKTSKAENSKENTVKEGINDNKNDMKISSNNGEKQNVEDDNDDAKTDADNKIKETVTGGNDDIKINADNGVKEAAKNINNDIKTSTISENTQDHDNSANQQDWSHIEDDKLPYDPNDSPDQLMELGGDQSQNMPEPSEQRDVISRYHSIRSDEESHFFTYFTVVSLISIAAYIGYHNKQKILAIVLEGRRSRNSRGRRRPSTANYRKLDCTLEEAVTSQCNANVTHVIY